MAGKAFGLAALLGLALSAVLAACSQEPAQQAQSVAPPPAKEFLYVSDERGDAVVVVDPESNTIVAKIAAGKRPRGIRLAPDGKHIFVAVSGSPIGGPNVDESKLPPPDRTQDGIAVIDVATNTVVRTYKAGDDPETFAITPDGALMLVSNEDKGVVSVMNLATQVVEAEIPVGDEPEGIDISPDGRTAVVASEAAHGASFINIPSRKVMGKATITGRPRSVKFSADGAKVYVTNEGGEALVEVDAKTMKILRTLTIKDPKKALPMDVVLTPDGSKFIVSNGRAGSVAILDAASGAVTTLVADAGQRPWGIALSADGKKIYSANGPSGEISQIDLATGQVVSKLAVGVSPWGVASAMR